VSPRLRFDLVLNNLVAWAVATGRVHIQSDGTPWRPLVHIEDISRAFAAALDAPRERIHNQAFNVGATAENYRVRELAEIVRQTVPGCQIEYAAEAGPDKRCYRVNCDKLTTFLPAAKPRWDARSGALQLYEAFKTNGVSVEDFEGSRFSRLGHIKKLIEKGDLSGKLQWTDSDREERRQDSHAYASSR
jgi:nucleoside-diphosphate-sugar epimerase